ncbi:MAG TPA: hypothetical protein PKJ15_05095 [Methanomassiliicoccales archaeon]|nr:hypothetical protein [Methanomassiliicoccales archaeon]
MIRRTFLLLPGIGQLKERRLWETGVLSWEEFLERRHPAGISIQRKEDLDQELGRAKELWDRDVRNTSPDFSPRDSTGACTGV